MVLVIVGNTQILIQILHYYSGLLMLFEGYHQNSKPIVT